MNKFFLFSMLLYSVISQAQNFPRSRYSSSHSLRDYVEKTKEKTKVFGMGFSYSQLLFLNPTFGEGTKNGDLKQKWGAAMNFRFRMAPLFLDAEAQWHNFDTQSEEYIHLGSELSVSSVLLPLHYKSLAVLQPYLGLGYHYGALVANTTSSRAIIASPFFKTGIVLNLHPNFYIDATYRQSIFGNKERAFNGYNLGIGLRGKALGKFWVITGSIAAVLAAIALGGSN